VYYDPIKLEFDGNLCRQMIRVSIPVKWQQARERKM